jgi:hypothetical protein
MYDARRYLVVERPSGQLAITTAWGLGSQKLRKDMKVIRRPNGDLEIVKRHRRRPRPVHHVIISEQPGSVSISYTKLTGEWARLSYLYNLLNR